MAEFKDRLKELRRAAHLTQGELSERLHISKGAISNYERGYRVPDKETLSHLADIFNVDMDYLIGRDNVSQLYVDSDEIELIRAYRSLTDEGKERTRLYVSDMLRLYGSIRL